MTDGTMPPGGGWGVGVCPHFTPKACDVNARRQRRPSRKRRVCEGRLGLFLAELSMVIVRRCDVVWE
jgi:hypothetical protein